MNEIPTIFLQSPGELIRGIGGRLRRIRLARGLTQRELAERAGVGLSTLKLMESEGRGSLQRLARIAAVLGVEDELRSLFDRPLPAASIEAVKRSEQKRARRSNRRRTNF